MTLIQQLPHARRQQKQRQAATHIVQSFFLPKKSRAQPRPVVTIPPKGIGPVDKPNDNDVLCGRGGKICSYVGNVQFRNIVKETKTEYLSESTKKMDKAHIAAKIVQRIRTMDPPGRFLKEDKKGGPWFDIGDEKAIKKVCQALREDAPDIRQNLQGDPNSKGSTSASSSSSPRATASTPKATETRTETGSNTPPQYTQQPQQLQQQQQQQQQPQQQQTTPTACNSMMQMPMHYTPQASNGNPASISPVHPGAPVLVPVQVHPAPPGTAMPAMVNGGVQQQTMPPPAMPTLAVVAQPPYLTHQSMPMGTLQTMPPHPGMGQPQIMYVIPMTPQQQQQMGLTPPPQQPQQQMPIPQQQQQQQMPIPQQQQQMSVPPQQQQAPIPQQQQQMPMSQQQMHIPQQQQYMQAPQQQIPMQQVISMPPQPQHAQQQKQKEMHSMTPQQQQQKQKQKQTPINNKGGSTKGNSPNSRELFTKLAKSRNTKSHSASAQAYVGNNGKNNNDNEKPMSKKLDAFGGEFHPISDEGISEISGFSGMSSMKEGSMVSGLSSLTAGTACGGARAGAPQLASLAKHQQQYELDLSKHQQLMKQKSEQTLDQSQQPHPYQRQSKTDASVMSLDALSQISADMTAMSLNTNLMQGSIMSDGSSTINALDISE